MDLDNSKSIRIVFMGTPEFAVASLSALNEAGVDVVGVVTSPDKPAGRGKKIKSSALKEFAANELNCPILQPENLKDPDFIQSLRALEAHIFIVVAFRMLPKEVWTIPSKGCINLHASLLPQYRGAAPINWSIINGEKRTGLTTFLIDHQIDTGSILLQEQSEITEDETAGTLHDKLMNLGSELIVKTVFKQMTDDNMAVDQKDFNIPEKDLKKAPKIFKDDCRIDWNKNNTELDNLIRGLSPYPGAFSVIKMSESEEIHIKIYKSRQLMQKHSAVPGTVFSDNKSTFHVATGNGILEILELQAAGKNKMSGEDFVRGFKMDLNKSRFD